MTQEETFVQYVKVALGTVSLVAFFMFSYFLFTKLDGINDQLHEISQRLDTK